MTHVDRLILIRDQAEADSLEVSAEKRGPYPTPTNCTVMPAI